MSRAGDKFIAVSGKILGETTKAIRFSVEKVVDTTLHHTQYKSIWLPLSQVNTIVRQPPHSPEMDTLKISEWIWKQKVDDSWNGKDPRNAGSSQVDEEQGLDDLDSDGDDAPW